MSDAVLFGLIFAAFFVLRLIAATVFFFFILPQGDHCPNCDAVTLRVKARGLNALLPWFRTSWCIECNWHGLLRHGRVSPANESVELSKQRR
jgi:hypothetical protein